MKHPRILLGVLAVALLLGIAALSNQDDSSPAIVQASGRSMTGNEIGNPNVPNQQTEITVGGPVSPVKVGPITTLPLYDGEYGLDREINPRMTLNPAVVPAKVDEKVDPLLAIQAEAEGLLIPDDFDTPIINQNGQGFTGVNPPDTIGDIGPDHFLQMINSAGGAVFTVYNKADGTVAAGPITLDSLAPSGSCASGLGDPVVIYDVLTSRWLLSEFSSSGNFICMYVSDSDDPVTATWDFYGFQFASFPDYFKIGIWPDSLFVSLNTGGNIDAAAMDWQAMLAGQPASFVTASNAPPQAAFGFQTFTPADRDGFIDVPAGSPGIFMRHYDDEAHNPGSANPAADHLEIWEFDVDWSNPGAATFSQAPNVEITEFSSEMCGFVAFSCVPQPGTGVELDPLREPVMWKLQYRNFGSHETLVGNFVTDVDGTDHHGIRWFELRRTGGDWDLYQEGTLAPDDDHRFMGAAAMDNAGNIALIYNVSSSTTFPSIRYIGRLAGDPLGSMPQGEYPLVAGSASNNSNRYGDYSSLTVDPIDDCTFWGTAEYNTSGQWSTRIGAFRFDACGTPGFYLGANPNELAACVNESVTSTITVGQVAGFTDPVTLSTNNLPANVTSAFNPNPVVPPGSSELTLNIGAATAGSYTIEVVGTAGAESESTSLDLTIYSAAPSAPALVAPPDGAVDVSRNPLLDWNAAGQAAEYQVQVATDAGFTNIVIDETTTETSYQASGLTPLTTYYWRVRASNGCGEGAWSEVWSFTTLDTPPILLVDDDDNSPDVLPLYQGALSSLGLDWDEWDTNNSDDEPTAAELSAYEAVIWFTGDEFGGAAGPGAAGEAALATWLDESEGHKLLLTSQDYHYDRGLTPFMTGYLGVGSITDDNGDYVSVTGLTDPFTGLSYTLDYPGSDFSDVVTPGSGEVAFVGNNQNNAALVEEGADWCTSFWVFPLEAIDTEADRAEALDAFLSWPCGGGGGPTPTPTATGPATSIQLSSLESANGGSTPWLLLSLAGIAGLAGAAWVIGRRTR